MPFNSRAITDSMVRPTADVARTKLADAPVDITATRAVDTEYRNTSGQTMLVKIWALMNPQNNCSIAIAKGAVSGALQNSARFRSAGAATVETSREGVIVSCIPAGWYYSVPTVGVAPTVQEWEETLL